MPPDEAGRPPADDGNDVTTPPPIGDRLRAAGAYNLGKDSGPDAVQAVLRSVAAFAHQYEEDDRALLRATLIEKLKAGGVHGPANVVDAYLVSRRQDPEPEERETAPEELLEAGREILEADDPLQMFRDSVRRLGYAGSTAAAEILHVALHSRSLDRPINVGFHGPSAGGKTFTVEVVLQHHPEDAVHDLTASSERALAYSDFKSEHAFVLISEASALHRDGVGATIIRGLAWGAGIRYETVERSPEGGLQARIIEKPGPTGLITTSTRSLDPEISTRLLQVHIADSPGQTEAIVEVLGNEAAGGRERNVDLTAWHAASKWLEVAGNRETVVPFAPQLAKCVPYDDVRMRRDFTQILTVLRALAFMQQRHRERDDQGRVVASRSDYENAYRLLAEVLAVTLDSVTDATRETVAAVEELTTGTAGGVSYLTLAEYLGMSRSGAWRRGQTALRDGFLINVEDRPGYPARLKLGDPLPPARPILPNPDDLFSVTPPKTTQRLNTGTLKPTTTRKTGVARSVDSSEVLSQRLEARNSSRNGPFPRGSAENTEGVEALRGFEGGSEGEDLIRAVADRAHAAAAELDAILGGEAATTYTYKALAGLGSAPDLAAVTELADKLESRLRQTAR